MYNLQFTDQSVDVVGKAPINVAVGTQDNSRTSLTFTGKGAANYGTVQQQNLLHILESFASPTEPENATVGQIWYDTLKVTLKVLVEKNPNIWKSLGGIQITDDNTPPYPQSLGDLWFSRTGPASGVLYVYTGLGRYPQTALTIGGWDQMYPTVETFAGRDEYDAILGLVMQIAGDPIGSYGNGIIGRAIKDLTNFGPLDRDMRVKYDAIALAQGTDPNVLVSTAEDQEITTQAVSNTLFLFNDQQTSNDSIIAGIDNNGVPDITIPGRIFIGATEELLPIADLNTDLKYEEKWIMWDRGDTIQVGRPYFAVDRTSTGQWRFDKGGAAFEWEDFTPTEECFIIGSISTFQQDRVEDDIYPGTKTAVMWANAVKIIGVKTSHLKVESNSQDWDTLLAAAKFAINRLEVPETFVKSISATPFVNDGRQAPASLTELLTSDVRYPSAARRSNRVTGVITQVQNFTETVNALNGSIANRFSIKGINGASGSWPDFDSNVDVQPWTSQSRVVSTGSSSMRTAFRFANESDKGRFLYAGGAIEIEVKHEAGSTTADTNLRALLAQGSVFRLTADKLRVFGNSLPLTLTRSIGQKGLWNATPAGFSVGSYALGGASLSVQVFRVGSTGFDIDFAFNAGGALGGTTTVTWKVIGFNDVYTPGPVLLFTRPISFVEDHIINPL